MDFNIKMDSIKLKAVKSVKFLGVIFDYKLMFENHVRDKIIILLEVNNIGFQKKP